jgi:hypothetical protein
LKSIRIAANRAYALVESTPWIVAKKLLVFRGACWLACANSTSDATEDTAAAADSTLEGAAVWVEEV